MDLPAKTDTLPTRVSLIERLKNLEDDRSWSEFFLRYEQKILGVARSRGLAEHDAEDVAQEVFKRLTETIGNYRPAPRPGSFRSWLFKLTRWRATDQLRKRNPSTPPISFRSPGKDGYLDDRTPTIERLPAPEENEHAFAEESRRHLIDSLLKRVERSISPKQLQIFQMLVLDEVPVTKIAELYGMTAAAVYVIKHRTLAKLREEISDLRVD